MEWLAEPLKACRNSGGGGLLQNIYGEIPPTTCRQQGLCCGLLPPVQRAEALVFLFRLQDIPPEEMEQSLQALLEHFIKNAAHRLACPWRREDGCTRYDQRFLACRGYGLWSRRAYGERRVRADQAQEQVVAAWRSLGVELPAQVTAPGPDYCANVLAVGEESIDDARLRSLEQRLSRLGERWDPKEELSFAAGDLSFLAARLCLGGRQALTAKVDYTRSILSGDDEAAGQVLREAGRAAREAARLFKEL